MNPATHSHQIPICNIVPSISRDPHSRLCISSKSDGVACVLHEFSVSQSFRTFTFDFCIESSMLKGSTSIDRGNLTSVHPSQSVVHFRRALLVPRAPWLLRVRPLHAPPSASLHPVFRPGEVCVGGAVVGRVGGLCGWFWCWTRRYWWPNLSGTYRGEFSFLAPLPRLAMSTVNPHPHRIVPCDTALQRHFMHAVNRAVPSIGRGPVLSRMVWCGAHCTCVHHAHQGAHPHHTRIHQRPLHTHLSMSTRSPRVTPPSRLCGMPCDA